MVEQELTKEYGELSENLRFLIDVTMRAGHIILELRPDQIEFTRKGPDKWGDFVSAADLASQALILQELRSRFPNDQILSEEQESSIDYTHIVWMVDPLDGTKEFKYGGDRYSVMIGRYRDGRPDLGVVYAPAAKTLLVAESGGGAWRQVARGPLERLRVNLTETLDDARFVIRKSATSADSRSEQDAFDAVLPGKQRIPDSSIGLKFGRIAAGEAEASINTNHKGSKWDTCAPQAILEEAGGKVTDLDGNPLDYTQTKLNWQRSFVASNGVLHPQVLELCKNLKF